MLGASARAAPIDDFRTALPAMYNAERNNDSVIPLFISHPFAPSSPTAFGRSCSVRSAAVLSSSHDACMFVRHSVRGKLNIFCNTGPCSTSRCARSAHRTNQNSTPSYTIRAAVIKQHVKSMLSQKRRYTDKWLRKPAETPRDENAKNRSPRAIWESSVTDKISTRTNANSIRKLLENRVSPRFSVRISIVCVCSVENCSEFCIFFQRTETSLLYLLRSILSGSRRRVKAICV